MVLSGLTLISSQAILLRTYLLVFKVSLRISLVKEVSVMRLVSKLGLHLLNELTLSVLLLLWLNIEFPLSRLLLIHLHSFHIPPYHIHR
jgi:uncharacterized membrane protein